MNQIPAASFLTGGDREFKTASGSRALITARGSFCVLVYSLYFDYSKKSGGRTPNICTKDFAQKGAIFVGVRMEAAGWHEF